MEPILRKVRSRAFACHVGVGYPVDKYGNWVVFWGPSHDPVTYPHIDDLVLLDLGLEPHPNREGHIDDQIRHHPR